MVDEHDGPSRKSRKRKQDSLVEENIVSDATARPPKIKKRRENGKISQVASEKLGGTGGTSIKKSTDGMDTEGTSLETPENLLSLHPGKPEGKRKTRKRDEGAEAVKDDVPCDMEVTPRKEKKKRHGKGDKQKNVNCTEESVISGDAEVKPKKKRKDAEKNEDIAVDDREGIEMRPTDKMEKKPNVEAALATTSSPPVVEKSDRKKKRKNKTGAAETRAGGTSEESQQVIEVESTKKKKRKEKGKMDHLPKPAEDSNLTEKARNALEYAYLRLVTPEKWKFNKALQNWIVKNIWSEEAIPQEYMVLIVGYLTDSQGSVRANLVQTCQNILSTPSTLPETPETPELPKTHSHNLEVSLSRARVLLDALEITTRSETIEA